MEQLQIRALGIADCINTIILYEDRYKMKYSNEVGWGPREVAAKPAAEMEPMCLS